MKIRSLVLATACAALAGVAAPGSIMAADPTTQAETVKTAFKHAIANVPGKTLTAVVVDYAPGRAVIAASPRRGLCCRICAVGRDPQQSR